MRVVIYLLVVAIAEGRLLSESNGPYHALLYSSFRTCPHGYNLKIDTAAIRVEFNDYANGFTGNYPIHAAADDILNILGLNKSNKFVVFVPGFTSAITPKTRRLLETSFNDPGTYVLVLHHFLYTNPLPNSFASYERSVAFVYHIGKALAEMLVTLSNNGVSPKNVHLIGHSLGAHMVGAAGRVFNEMSGDKIARITGLDPAGPCYYDAKDQLKSGEADFVDVYHCNAYQFGTEQNLGDVNFYVNDGISQPRCGSPPIPDITLSSIASACSHMACQNFYFLTVSQRNLFPASKCDSYQQFQNGGCQSDQTVAGYWTPDDVRGVYYTSTAGQSII